MSGQGEKPLAARWAAMLLEVMTLLSTLLSPLCPASVNADGHTLELEYATTTGVAGVATLTCDYYSSSSGLSGQTLLHDGAGGFVAARLGQSSFIRGQDATHVAFCGPERVILSALQGVTCS